MSLHERFWKKVDRRTDEECWEWLGAKKAHGYGMIAPDRMHLGGSPLQAHRVAWEIANGPIPDGHVIHHLCRNRSCMNPLHMEITTPEIHATSAVHPRITALTCRRGHSMEDAITVRETKRGTYRRCRTCYREKEARWTAERKRRRNA